MGEDFDLDSRIHAVGVFWDPAKPDEKSPAYLTSDSGVLTLLTAPVLGETDIKKVILNGARQENTPDILHGFSSLGPCTLVGLVNMGDEGLQDLTSGRGVTSRQFRVSTCLIGIELARTDTPCIRSATFRYKGLEGWFPSGVEISYRPQCVSLNYPSQIPTIVDCTVTPAKVRITIRIHHNLHLRLGSDYSASQEPVVAVEGLEPRSFDWFFDTAIRLENFFSLCVGTSVALKSVQVQLPDDSTGWVVHRLRSKIGKPDVTTWITYDGSQLSKAINSWFSAPDEFRSVENLIYGTIRHSSLFVETEFLSLAQALESFHRVSDAETANGHSEFRSVLRKLVMVIDESCGKSRLATRLKESIRHANEPSFHDRIEALLRRLQPSHVATLIGDAATFEQTLRQTRNYLTHPGIKKQTMVLTDPGRLFLFNQRVHALLRLLMLMSLGFSEDSVFGPIHQQSRRWKVL